jgi:hypothetical protein
MCPPRLVVLCNFLLLVISPATVAQDLPPQPKIGAKVCVATVANASTTSAFVERLTERLTKSLKQNKINAITMTSRTTERHPLELSTENGQEAKENECDYVLLSQIRDPRQQSLGEPPAEISIGGRPPSVDASDGRAVYRENLQVNFAVFRIGRFKAVLDASVLERPSANVADTLLSAMDREANRVDHELKKH